jgi:hypothetical protein
MSSQLRTMASARAAKAYVAGAIAGIGSLAPVAGDGISGVELLIASGVTLAAFQGTFWVSNGPAAEQGGDRDLELVDDEPAHVVDLREPPRAP